MASIREKSFTPRPHEAVVDENMSMHIIFDLDIQGCHVPISEDRQ
jgi:hypothetical protein